MDTYSTFIIQLIDQNLVAVAVMLACITVLKGIALWKAAQANQKNWFIALLLLNTLGILESVYIFFISKKYSVEIKEQ